MLEVTSIDARVFYDRNIEIGAVNYYEPFPIPPGLSHSPRLPVELNLGGIGYDAVRRAVDGTLELDTVAEVGVLIGNYSETINYQGQGIQANVKL